MESPDKTGTWALKYGYAFTKKSRSRRPGLGDDTFQQPNVPQRPAQMAPRVLAERAINNVDWNAMVVTKGLKGGDDKKVCLIDVNGTTMVLKGAFGTPESHVANTAFIGKLGLRGVKAPVTRVLNDQEKAGLLPRLAQGSVDEQQLGRALQGGTGQLSEQVSGVNLDKIFLNPDEKAAVKLADAVRENLAYADLDEAWKMGFEALLEETPKGSGVRRSNEFDTWAKTKDPAVRKAALAYMDEWAIKPGQAALAGVLKEVDSKTARAGVKRAQEAADAREQGKKNLANFAKSDAGVEAFAGVAAVDLLSGMHDRILSAWNGGNFMFDEAGGSLCCIDNSKNDRTDIRQQDITAWAQFFKDNSGGGKPLEDFIFERVYGKAANKDNVDAPGNYVDFSDAEAANAKAIIRGVLENAVAAIESDGPPRDPAMRDPAAERARVLKNKLQMDSIMRVPDRLLTPPAKPFEEDPLTKAKRKAKSKFSSEAQALRKVTSQIKVDLRDGYITADVARQRLKDAEDLYPALKTDRRASKVKFLAAATEFVELLKSSSADMRAFLNGKPSAAVWNDESGTVFLTARQPPVEVWLNAVAGDKDMTGLINKAWTDFVNAAQSN